MILVRCLFLLVLCVCERNKGMISMSLALVVKIMMMRISIRTFVILDMAQLFDEFQRIETDNGWNSLFRVGDFCLFCNLYVFNEFFLLVEISERSWCSHIRVEKRSGIKGC